MARFKFLFFRFAIGANPKIVVCFTESVYGKKSSS